MMRALQGHCRKAEFLGSLDQRWQTVFMRKGSKSVSGVTTQNHRGNRFDAWRSGTINFSALQRLDITRDSENPMRKRAVPFCLCDRIGHRVSGFLVGPMLQKCVFREQENFVQTEVDYC